MCVPALFSINPSLYIVDYCCDCSYYQKLLRVFLSFPLLVGSWCDRIPNRWVSILWIGHMLQFQGMKHCKMPTKTGSDPLLSTALNSCAQRF